MASLDATTLAEYAALSSATDRAAAIVSAFSAPVTLKIYNGLDEVVGTGSMDVPWATQSAGTVVLGDVIGFAVTASGTPDADWYAKIESGSRWIKLTFGLVGSAKEAVWSRSDWIVGTQGGLRNSVLTAIGNTAPLISGASTSLSFTAGVGGTYDFSPYATDAEGGTITYSLVGTQYTGISIGPTTGILSVGTTATAAVRALTVRVTDPGGLSSDWPVTVTVAASSDVTLLSDDFSSSTWFTKWHNPDIVTANNNGTNVPKKNPALTSNVWGSRLTRLSASQLATLGITTRQNVGWYLRATVPAGGNAGTTLSFFPRYVLDPGCWADALPYSPVDPTELWFEYYLLFDKDWKYSLYTGTDPAQIPNPRQQGKLPGFGSTFNGSKYQAGLGNTPSYGNNGFSARGGWDCPNGDFPYETICANGRVGMDTYYYYAGMMDNSTNPSGRGISWGDYTSCTSAPLPNTWHKITHRMKMNTRSSSYVWNSNPSLDGPNGSANGVLQIWVDDVPAMSTTNIRWVDAPFLNIERVWFDFYHGGGQVPPRDLSIFISDVRIWMP